jgi:hypothetical protein
VLLAAFSAGMVVLAPWAHPVLTLPLDGAWTALIATGLAVLMLTPIIDDGVSTGGVLLRGALSFAAVGMLAPAAMAVLNWYAGDLLTQTRLASLLSDAAPSIVVSAGVHGLAGAAAAMAATLFTCQLSR